MRVLLIGSYQGPRLVKERNILSNRSLAGSNKMHGICCALMARGHEVAIASVGRVAERTRRWFPAIDEEVRGYEGRPIPVWYMGAFDYRGIGNFVSWIELLRWLPRIFGQKPFDVAIPYNCNFDSVIASVYCRLARHCAVVLEHEDSALMDRSGSPPPWRRLRRFNEALIERCATGIYGPSPELVQAMKVPNRLLLEGVVSEALARAAANRPEVALPGQRLNVLYSGGLAADKGILPMLDALDLLDRPIEVHISGTGHQADEVRSRCARLHHPAFFHGLVSDDELVHLQTTADICVNPHRVYWHRGLSWPFKVAEYLAACGVVVSANTGRMDNEVRERLYLYDQDEPRVIADALRRVIDRWDHERTLAPERRRWAIARWGLGAVGQRLERLLLAALAPPCRERKAGNQVMNAKG